MSIWLPARTVRDPVGLSSHDLPDEIRGWGLVRVDAAVRAALLPLFPGDDQVDTLGQDVQRPVTARRLALSPGVRYLIEAVPEAGLDVDLAVINPRDMDDDAWGEGLTRLNSNGSGVSEFMYYHSEPDSWAFLVVRQVSGSGLVTLRVNEADSFTEPSVAVQLPGKMTGAPNVGRLAGSPGPTLVVSSRVDVDFVARSVNVFDSTGVSLPGWPVFVFPHPSAQGGLSQPLLWDLDGNSGDEIVLGSDFGSVYFFNRLGGLGPRRTGFQLAFDHSCGHGGTRGWAAGPGSRSRRHPARLVLGAAARGDPIPGPSSCRWILRWGNWSPGTDEELVIAFASGVVLVTDSVRQCPARLAGGSGGAAGNPAGTVRPG